jgi:TatD DNase family protein
VIDTHAHLDALAEPEAVLARAREAGVTRVITIGTGIESSRAALALAAAGEGVYAALGIDPHQAATPEAERLGELRDLLAHDRAVAVGEAGLDYHYGGDRKAEQRRLFQAQLVLAAELGAPVVVHTRAANADTEAMLRGHDGTVVMHCFSEPELLDAGLERGWYFSFAGNATYPKAADLREAAAAVPADRILAETDSPYLAPQPLRGRTNEPAHVVHTLAVLAAARSEEPAALADRIDANATAAFRLA